MAPPLVVDLDRTLIGTDLLDESLASALGRNPLAALVALGRLREGKAALKRALADLAEIDVARLPYNPAVLAEIEAARAEGRSVVLVSAADDDLVRAVADHLGVFDEAHGSAQGTNLGGAAKARFLVERYGRHGFAYAGDRRADLAVWAEAAEAVTVGADPALRAAAERAAPAARHLPGHSEALAAFNAPPDLRPPTGLRALLSAVRPHQWLKNALVFLPALAAHATDPATWIASAVAFATFSLAASSVYLTNDLLDIEADRAHPRKRLRPFAAGTLAPRTGLLLAPVFALAGLALALATLPAAFAGALGAYLAATLAYSLWLKRLLVIDVCLLAMLYTLRVIAGGAATGIALSPWLLAFSGFLFLGLAAMKRQVELAKGIAEGRAEAPGRAYRAGDLPILAAMGLSSGYLSVLVLALYIDSDAVAQLYAAPELLLAACPVVAFWVSWMAMAAHRGEMEDDPLLFATRDPVSIGSGAAAGLLALAASLAGGGGP